MSTNTEMINSAETIWYVLRVVSGKEKKVKEVIEKEFQQKEWVNHLKQVLLPTEKVYRINKGKKTIKERNYYPGYLMIEISDKKINDDLKDLIKNTQNVIHFLGKDTPIPLRQNEVNKMLGKMDQINETAGVMMEPFLVGETVKIIDGPFNNFNATIEEVNDEKKKMKASVKIFGRSTPVELNYLQVEKIV